jgi:hypothetical protein
MEHQAEALNQGRTPEKKGILWVVLLISALLFGFTGAQLLDIKNSNIETREQSLSGQVLLTEEKLKSLVEDENLTVYWGGPRPGYLYSLDASLKDKTFLRYIKENKESSDVLSNSRVIATYYTKDGFARTVAAATLPGNTGFRNLNGSVVFYAKAKNTGVYLAFPGEPVQIEIFDPLAGQALSLAILQDQITEIGK